jgi:hypothetical protein
MGELTFTPKAISCRTLGYGETTNPSMHNTYVVLNNNAAYYLHDCYFEHYQEAPILLDADELTRYVDTYAIITYENTLVNHTRYQNTVILMNIIFEQNLG